MPHSRRQLLANAPSHGFLASEDAVDVACRAPVLVDQIGPIGDQASVADHVTVGTNHGQLMLGRNLDDVSMKNIRPAGCRQDQAAVPGTRECRKGALDASGVAQVNRKHFQSNRRRHRLDDTELSKVRLVSYYRRPRNAWRDLSEQLRPFPTQIVFEREEAGGIAARSRQTLDQAGGDRIRGGGKNDRHRAGQL
jgi:hypothetical protein